MLQLATFALPPVSALMMLAGIFYGAQYGGSTTAILVNLPGETSSVVTALDGYQMARQGFAGRTLAVPRKSVYAMAAMAGIAFSAWAGREMSPVSMCAGARRGARRVGGRGKYPRCRHASTLS